MAISVGAAVAISVILSFLVSSAGAVLAALITYCCVGRRKSSGQLSPRLRNKIREWPGDEASGQPHLTPSEDPQPASVYDEVGAGKLEVKENVAYGPMVMKQNPSYGPVGH